MTPCHFSITIYYRRLMSLNYNFTNYILNFVNHKVKLLNITTYKRMNNNKLTRILFVCLGNICRSAAANGVMESMVSKEGLEDNIIIDSAGTYGGHAGELPDPRMRVAASRRGYNLTHRSRRITEEDFYKFDMIIVMDDSNYENVARLAPERKYLDKVYRFVEFSKHHPEWSYVPDPYYEGHEGFELVLDLLEDGCTELLQQLKQEKK